VSHRQSDHEKHREHHGIVELANIKSKMRWDEEKVPNETTDGRQT
jgi:hypothetical protein